MIDWTTKFFQPEAGEFKVVPLGASSLHRFSPNESSEANLGSLQETEEISKRTWGFETTLLSKNHLQKISEFLQSIWGDFHMPRSSFHQKWKPKSNNSSISSSTSTRFSHQVTYHDPSTGVATAASHHLGKRSSHQSSSPVSFHSLILLMLQKSGDHQWLLVYPIYRVLAPSEVVSRISEPSTVSSKWN